MGRFGVGMNRQTFGVGVLGAILLLIAVVLATGTASSQTTATDPDCTNPATLGSGATGSAFEIDTDANLVVNSAGCIDWLTGTPLAPGTWRSGVIAKSDTQSGSGDESFGKGTAEDNPNPTIVSGSIPPNKSDLKAFGIYTEAKYLELFWSRVQNPSGTTNMDFELNKEFCDGTAAHCANNGTADNPVYETPKRTLGDKLITYDLSRGGTVPTISIRTWTGSAWSSADVISDGLINARGSVNTSTIPAAQTDGALPPDLTALGQQDPYTFGEAAISFQALFGSDCGHFGSAYLKSRSSDSFTSEIKDFVPPEEVNVGNCESALTTTASGNVTLGQNPAATIHDTAHLTAPDGTTGSITFKLYDSVAECQTATDVKFTSTNTTVNGTGFYDSANFTPTVAGTYIWTATFVPTAGQGVNGSGPTSCTDPAEDVVVSKANSSILSAQNYLPNDTATISGAGTLNGTVTFTLYRTDALCQADTNNDNGTAVYTQSGVALGAGNTASTNNTTYKVEDANEGNYTWGVTYSGDATNNGSRSCVEDSSVAISNS
jgi:hypothetical protein